MKLILRNQIVRTAEIDNLSGRTSSKAFIALALASVVTGVNYYFQNFVAQIDNQRQTELINRVSNDETSSDFIHTFNFHQADNWQCKKITLDGTLKDGRFLVKRNRGNEEGYIVLAPFTVQKDKALSTKRKVERKFVLNLGWIPKHSKHLIKTVTAADVIGQNQYTAENRIEAIEKQKYDQLLRDPRHLTQMSTITTVQAYVRRGEEREVLNGLNNWRDRKLYKFIDLAWLSRLFKIANEDQASTVYLERIAKTEEETEVVPIPTNKQHVIEDLKERIELNNKNRDRNVAVVGAGSAVAALLFSVL